MKDSLEKCGQVDYEMSKREDSLFIKCTIIHEFPYFSMFIDAMIIAIVVWSRLADDLPGITLVAFGAC